MFCNYVGFRQELYVKAHLLLKCVIIQNLKKMLSSGILLRVALVRTDVSKESVASIISVTRNGEIGTT
jgi:hypothetical protein